MFLAQQQAYFQQAQAALQNGPPRSPMLAGPSSPNGFYPFMPYGVHPSSFAHPPANGSLQPGPSTRSPRSRASSYASSSAQHAPASVSTPKTEHADGTPLSEVDRLREELARVQERGKRADIHNERTYKELEIARWRLQCVEVERKQEDRQVCALELVRTERSQS